MPKVGKKLNVIDINNNTVEEETKESITTMNEEIDEQMNKLEKIHDDKGITKKVNDEMNEKTNENIVIQEEKPLKPDRKKKSAEYMKEYRKIKQEEQKKLKEDLKHKTEIIEKIAEKPIDKPEPQIIERIIEKEVIVQKPRAKSIARPKKVVIESPIQEKEPDYNNIPEEIIQKEIRKRQVSTLEMKRMKKKESMDKLKMNIA